MVIKNSFSKLTTVLFCLFACIIFSFGCGGRAFRRAVDKQESARIEKAFLGGKESRDTISSLAFWHSREGQHWAITTGDSDFLVVFDAVKGTVIKRFWKPGTEEGEFKNPADLAVVDVSFISLTKVLLPATKCLTERGEVLALVKPQFEVGRGQVGKGGVVRDEAMRLAAAEQVIGFADRIGLTLKGRIESRIAGPKGNREIFIYLTQTVDGSFADATGTKP